MKVNMPLEIAEDFGRVPPIQGKRRHDSPPEAAVRPILLLLVGTSGSGRTTFYETHLKTAFPTLLKSSASPLEQTEADQERKRLMKTGKSLVCQDVVFDPQLICEAKSVGFEVKAVYVATEDPILNLGRILIRVNNGGRFAPISRIAHEYAQGVRQLPKVKKVADDLMLFDNTAHARDVRLVAHFRAGNLVKLARQIPKWAQKTFGKKFTEWLKPSS